MLAYFGTTLADLNSINGGGLVAVLLAIVLSLVATPILLVAGIIMYLRERRTKHFSNATRVTIALSIVTFVIFSVLYSLYFLL